MSQPATSLELNRSMAVWMPGASHARLKTVAVAGNPNAGKTTVFNLLSGARAKVGNYPGVTVERASAEIFLPGGQAIEIADVPGTYSLTARSQEEALAVDVIAPWQGRGPDAVLLVLDATALERNLYFALQVIETGTPVVVALNMMDEARSLGVEVDVQRLHEQLGVAVVPMVASKGQGKVELLAALEQTLADENVRNKADWVHNTAIEDAIVEMEGVIQQFAPTLDPERVRARALWALLSADESEISNIPSAVRQGARAIRTRLTGQGVDVDQEIIQARYDSIHNVLTKAHKDSVARASTHIAWTDRADRLLMHPWIGMSVFLLVMIVLFESLFAWSEPLMSFIEACVSALQTLVATTLPSGPFNDLLVFGVFGGVGNVVVFVPQIACLFLFLGFLEDSGYLARVAYMVDRLMKGVGLHGKAFIPLLSGFACAIPAVMATRTLENRRDRLITMLVLPLVACSARLPVFMLMVASVFASTHIFGGALSLASVVLAGMYVLSLVVTLFVAWLLRRTILRGPRPALILELPPYRMPVARNLMLNVWTRVRSFLVDAGTVILALTVVLWALFSYPKDPSSHAKYETLKDHARETTPSPLLEEKLAKLQVQEARAELEASFAGHIGHWMEPVLAPLGFDWKISVAVLGSFAAREVFVSTLGMVYGIEKADGNDASLREKLRTQKREDGTLLFTPLLGFSIMVFFLFACQCMSTIAVVRRESGSWKWPLFMFTYTTSLAYVASLLVYQGGRILGFT